MIILNLIAILSLSLGIVFLSYLTKQHSKEIKALQEKQKNFVLDINTLQKNNVMLSLSLKELLRIVRKYEKGNKKSIRL